MEVSIHKDAHRGFTLLELIVCVVIIGIVGTKVMLSWQVSSITVVAQASKLANDIRYAQVMSMTSGERYRVVKISSTTYQIQNFSGTAVRHPVLGITTITLGSGMTFGTLTNLPNNLVAFDDYGVPYTTSTSPGTALAAAATIPITAGGKTSTVQITPTTGRVAVI